MRHRDYLFYCLFGNSSADDLIGDSADDVNESILGEFFFDDVCGGFFEELGLVLDLSPERDRCLEVLFDLPFSLLVIVVVVIVDSSCGVMPSVAGADMSGEAEGVEPVLADGEADVMRRWPPRPCRRRA